ETSGTGVGFTRDPRTGERHFYAEFLANAQGEDVVAGIRTPEHIDDLKRRMPVIYDELLAIADRLERHYKDMQDIEFTIQEGTLYLLQTRAGKRSAAAAAAAAGRRRGARRGAPSSSCGRRRRRRTWRACTPRGASSPRAAGARHTRRWSPSAWASLASWGPATSWWTRSAACSRPTAAPSARGISSRWTVPAARCSSTPSRPSRAGWPPSSRNFSAGPIAIARWACGPTPTR